jgi:antirestriction protein ArdC
MESQQQSSVSVDVYELVTNRIVEFLEKGTIPWQKPWTEAGVPRNLVTNRQYRGINILLLQSLGYTQNLFLTWEQLKSIGGSVKRGEKSHLVTFWKPMGRKEKGKKATTEYELRYYRVFNVIQCKDIPENVHQEPLQVVHDPIKACEAILGNMPDCPTIEHNTEGAYYLVQQDAINLPNKPAFKTAEGYYATLFHELVHSTGHKSRLNREGITATPEYGAELYCLEELVAELGTAYLCSQGGILPKEIENTAAYIKGWIAPLRNDKQFIVKASSLAQRAVDYILKTQDEETPGKE